MRVNLGFSPAVTMESETTELSGGAMACVVSLGKFINDRFLMYGEVIGDVITAPEMTVGGITYTSSEEISATTSGVGFGLGYYLVPNSVFAGFSLNIASMTLEHTGLGLKGETDPGFGFAFQIGKDWSISPKSMLGIAGHVFFASMKDKGGGPRWTSSAMGVVATWSWVPRGWKR